MTHSSAWGRAELSGQALMHGFFVAAFIATFAVLSFARGETSAGALPIDGKCPVAADSQHWTKQEIFVWQQVCIGKIADFNLGEDFGGQIDPKDGSIFPDSRILRPRFLETILLTDKYRNVLPRLGVQISGARFTEKIELIRAEIRHDLWLNKSLLERGVDFSDATFSGNLGLQDTRITGTATMDGLTIGNGLVANGAEFEKVSLQRARISRLLEFSKAKGKSDLVMYSIRVVGNAYLQDISFTNVNLVNANIDGILDFSRAKLTSTLWMSGLHVAGDLSMLSSSFANVTMINTFVGGTFSLSGAIVKGTLLLDRLNAKSSVFMGNGSELSNIVLTGAYIGGQLNFIKAKKISGTVECYGMTVDQTAFFADVGEFSNKIRCRSARFRENLSFRNSFFAETTDFTGAKIDGELHLGPAGATAARWADGKSLILNNAQAQLIPAFSDAWPETIEMDGFSYRAVRNITTENQSRQSETPLHVFESWFKKQPHYEPQAYEQLAVVFHNYGQAENAATIRYAGRERERSESTGRRYVWLSALNWVIGYGYHFERVVGWIVGFIAFGAVVLRVSGEGPNNGMPIGVSYSFDMLLPVVKLREAHYKIDLAGWPRYYFYLHKIAGFILASFLIAGISGLTK